MSKIIFSFFSIIYLSSCAFFKSNEPPIYYKVSVKSFTVKQLVLELYPTDRHCPFNEEKDEFHKSCMALDKDMMFIDYNLAFEYMSSLGHNKCIDKKVELTAFTRDEHSSGIVESVCSSSFSKWGSSSVCESSLKKSEKNTFTFECRNSSISPNKKDNLI